MKKGRIVWKVFAGIALAALCAFLLGYVMMYLWNWLVPELFNGPVITFWQALGLFILSKLIFGFGGGGDKSSEGGWSWKKKKWKERMKAKMETMSPEERANFKDKLNRCMGGPFSSWKREEEEQPEKTQKEKESE